jgi:hypothetical protein
MRVLFLGDIVGKPGRRTVMQDLPGLRQELKVDLVVANGENASGGIGLTRKNASQLLSTEIDVLTSGNHIWKHKDILPMLDSEVRVLRPANYPPGAPGPGVGVYAAGSGNVAVINLLGRTFMGQVDCPFRTADQILRRLDAETKVILVDFHAEATSEKKALAFYLQDRVSAVLGTHTHVQTADPGILGSGTACITDVGMCGPVDSVIGMKAEGIVKRFVTGLPQPFEVASGRVVLQGALVEIDQATGRAGSIQALNRQVDGLAS